MVEDDVEIEVVSFPRELAHQLLYPVFQVRPTINYTIVVLPVGVSLQSTPQANQ